MPDVAIKRDVARDMADISVTSPIAGVDAGLIGFYTDKYLIDDNGDALLIQDLSTDVRLLQG